MFFLLIKFERIESRFFYYYIFLNQAILHFTDDGIIVRQNSIDFNHRCNRTL